MSILKNIAKWKKERIEKHDDECTTHVFRQDARELVAVINEAAKKIENVYDKYALENVGTNCGTVIIMWRGDEAWSKVISENRQATERITKNTRRIFKELLDE